MSWQVLCLHHELKDAQPYALPLQRLVHVEVEHAAWLDLRHSASCDEQILVTCLEQGQRFALLNDHVQKLVALRVDKLLVSRDCRSKSLSNC